MEEKILKLKNELDVALKKASKEADILNIKSEYVGKKSEISEFLASIKDMSVDDKRKYGSLINISKKEMEELLILILMIVLNMNQKLVHYIQ